MSKCKDLEQEYSVLGEKYSRLLSENPSLNTSLRSLKPLPKAYKSKTTKSVPSTKTSAA